MASKRKRLNLKEKIDVLEVAEKEKLNVRSLAERSHVGITQINELLKGKEGIRKTWVLNSNENLKFQKEKYFSYSSKEIQNEILELMSKQVCEAVASVAIQSDCYSILVDETADIVHDEQVAIVIPYVRPEDFSVHERFLCFSETRNTEGETLAILLKNVLETFRLPLSKIRTQC
ncbi:hypothetical protein AVEN_21801-1 [Araneus ventricosus]|uniref:DUF4371 domain-containing protein n=1 Tax=Araneus ventricosus TaxID=182803 RepID=A0A4Y2IQY4_ARAVE|nr:hypothetical protein AVEN_21801-1 [Araneus ventricosus]